jgi:hypothetical protein
VDSRSGRISRKTSGSIPTDSPVFVDYDVRQIRIDLIEIKPNGTVVLKNGTPSKTAPPLPEVDSGALPLARVFLDYGAASLSPDAIFSIGPPLPPVTDADRKAMVAHVSRTRTKLQANEPVTIAFWSDMVPANGAAGASTHGFPEIVEAALQAQFKGAKVSIVNASFRGSNIAVRLPKLQDEVLSHHPDLVVVGFLNDMSLPQGELRRDYTTAVQQLKAAGCEVILTTPNLTAPSSPSLRALRERDGRKDVKIIRDVAREQGVGLADVSQRWEHLSQEGIPFTALLYNGIDQPDSRGQQIYANTIAKFF